MMTNSSRVRTALDRPSARRAVRPRSLFVAAPLLLAALVSSPAFAQSEQEKSASDKLYQEGLAKMLEGAFDVGCPKLAESQRLFPRPGTLFTLAECEAKAGRVATAMARYQEYLKLFAQMEPDQQAKQREKQRDKISQAQIDALSKQAPRLTIAAPSSASGLSVQLDGAAVDASRFGSEIPVDAGEHVVTWQAGGGAPTEQKVTLANGEKKQVEVGAGSGELPPGSGAPSGSDSGPSGRRIAALAAGGAGAAGILVGVITGGLAIGKKGTVADHCKDTGANDVWSCDAEGKDASESGKTMALVSTLGFGVGIAGLAAGAVLFFTEPPAPKKEGAAAAKRWVRPDVAIGPSGGFIGARGAW